MAPLKKPKVSIHNVPPELIVQISEYLDLPDIAKLSRVCRLYRRLLPRLVMINGKDFEMYTPGGEPEPESYFASPELPGKVDHLEVSVRWKDQGFGNLKGQIPIYLMRKEKQKQEFSWPHRLAKSKKRLVAKTSQPLGIAKHEWETVTKKELIDDPVVSEAQAGDYYHFHKYAGGGGGHRLCVENYQVIVYLEK